MGGAGLPPLPPQGPWTRPQAGAAEPSPPPASRGRRPPEVGIHGTDFIAAQKANRRATTLLLALLTLIAATLGYVTGWTLEANVPVQSKAGTWGDPSIWFVSSWGLATAALLGAGSLVWSMISLSFGDRIVMAMAGGREVTAADEPRLCNVVEEMAIAAGQPPPRVFVIDTDALNAFATGVRTNKAAVAVTRGLKDTLTREELQAVVAHEMGHIANLDTRYMTVVGVTVGLIAFAADIVIRVNGGGREQRRGAGFLRLLLEAVAFLAPLAARMVQMAVSRQREYLADATSVELTRNSAGLISALQKLDAGLKSFPGASEATQHLFIVNPFKRFADGASALMSTHPSTALRIERLRHLGQS